MHARPSFAHPPHRTRHPFRSASPSVSLSTSPRVFRRRETRWPRCADRRRALCASVGTTGSQHPQHIAVRRNSTSTRNDHGTTRCGGGRSCDRGRASCGRLFHLGILSSSGDEGDGKGDDKGGHSSPTHPPTPRGRARAAVDANAMPGGGRAPISAHAPYSTPPLPPPIAPPPQLALGLLPDLCLRHWDPPVGFRLVARARVARSQTVGQK